VEGEAAVIKVGRGGEWQRRLAE